MEKLTDVTRGLIYLLLLGSPCAYSQEARDAKHADWLFIGEHIVTMQSKGSTAGALAVKDDRIVWLGNARDGAQWRGPNTQVVELGSKALLPGFIDAHGHLSFMAATINMANVASPPVGPATDIKTLQTVLREHLVTNDLQPGEWLAATGYDDSLLAAREHPTRRDLDAVSKEHPIALMHVSGHLLAANSMALRIAGITADSPNPPGGHIRRFANSDEPNGVLEETAAHPLRAHMFGGSDPLGDLREAQQHYASFGITTAQEGAAGPETVELLQTAARQNALIMDVVAFPVARTTDPLPERWQVGRYQRRFKIGGVKLILDGSPQGKTAYLTKPYAVPPDGQGADYRGYPTLPLQRVKTLVAHYLEARIPMLAHANGDAAGDMLLDAVASALGEQRPDHRTVMIHAQAARLDQLDDMAELGIIPSFFAAHVYYWGDWHRDSVFGAERAAGISPTGSAVRRGMRFTIHNDAPIVPPNMLRLLWASTNRLTRSGQVLGPQERLSVYEALQAVTAQAAYQAFEEDSKGTLAVGKLADLVVLSRNPLTTPVAQLESVKVEQTWSHGRRIYAAIPKKITP